MGIERELMRGAGPIAILSLLARREMYGYELVQALERQGDDILSMGQSTLYPMLYNLEAKGLVRARWRDAKTGRRRKYYALTAKGRRQLADDRRKWHELVEAMRGLGILGARPGKASGSGGS